MDPNGIPSQAEFGLLRAYLAKSKMSQAQIDEAIGTAPNGRTRAEIASEITAWLFGNI
jgi:hypothetical protein